MKDWGAKVQATAVTMAAAEKVPKPKDRRYSYSDYWGNGEISLAANRA